MTEVKTSKLFSGSRPLWILLCLVAGVALSVALWRTSGTVSTASDWRTFAGVLAAVSATIVGFLAAVAAVLFAVIQAPLIKHLQQSGHDKTILFDLFSGICVWLVALLTALVGCIPIDEIPADKLAMTSFALSCAGALLFLPLGKNFWSLLTNISAQGPQPTGHDWSKPTRLE